VVKFWREKLDSLEEEKPGQKRPCSSSKSQKDMEHVPIVKKRATFSASVPSSGQKYLNKESRIQETEFTELKRPPLHLQIENRQLHTWTEVKHLFNIQDDRIDYMFAIGRHLGINAETLFICLPTCKSLDF